MSGKNFPLFIMEETPSKIDFEKVELKKLGARIRSIRKKLGYKTAESAANDFGIQRSQFTRYEAGANLNYVTLILLLQKMGVSLKDFFSEGFD